jgi:hypothetical protein
MKSNNHLKPQDVVVLLKLISSFGERSWRYSDLAKALKISQSEAHAAIKRAEACHLYDSLTKRPIRANLAEFLLHGMPYAFSASPGKMAVGIPTAHSAPVLNKSIISNENDQYVWPSRLGKTKGLAIEPLYPVVPNICVKDAALYEMLALVDAVRAGRAREKELASKLIRERLGVA